MSAAKIVLRNDVVSGEWKFDARKVQEHVLVELARDWKNEEPDRYLDLHVRKCSSEQFGIGFKYVFEGKDHKRFFHRMKAKLESRFPNPYGEDLPTSAFIGWDISSPTTLIE